MTVQISPLIMPLLKYSLESNPPFSYGKASIVSRYEMGFSWIVNPNRSQLTDDCYFYHQPPNTSLINKWVCGRFAEKVHFRGFRIIEPRGNGTGLNGLFLTSKRYTKRLGFIATKDGSNSPLLSQNWASGTTRLPKRLPKIKNPQKSLSSKGFHLITVVWEGIEPPTQRFSVFCSTD